MTRLILLMILGLVSTYYFPDSRQMLQNVTAPIVEPVIRWSTEQEMAQVGTNVLEHEQKTSQLPAGRGWLGLLENRDYRVISVREVPLLPGFVILVLGLGTLFIAWRREGR